MPDSLRAHLRTQFQRRLHPEIKQNGQSFIVKIEAARLRLPQSKIAEAQRQHACCKFQAEHLIMEGEHEPLCKCIEFLAQNEEDPWRDLHSRDGRRRPRSIVR